MYMLFDPDDAIVWKDGRSEVLAKTELPIAAVINFLSPAGMEKTHIIKRPCPALRAACHLSGLTLTVSGRDFPSV